MRISGTRKCSECIHVGVCSGVKDNKCEYVYAGRVLMLPCKLGDTVFRIVRSFHTHVYRIVKSTVVRIAITEDQIQVFTKNQTGKAIWGENVFLTREEAETALNAKG